MSSSEHPPVPPASDSRPPVPPDVSARSSTSPRVSMPEGELTDSVFGRLLPDEDEMGEEIMQPPPGTEKPQPPKLPETLAPHAEADPIAVPPRRDRLDARPAGPPRFARENEGIPFSAATITWIVLGCVTTLVLLVLLLLLLFSPSEPPPSSRSAEPFEPPVQTRVLPGKILPTGVAQSRVAQEKPASVFPWTTFLPPLLLLQADTVPPAAALAKDTRDVGTEKGETEKPETPPPAAGQPLKEHQGKVLMVAYSADGARFATVSADRSIIVRDGMSGEPLCTIEGRSAYRQAVTAVALNRNGTVVAGASRDKTVVLWDVASGEKTDTFSTPDEIRSVALTPDNAFLVAGLDSGPCCVWDVRTRKEVALLRVHGKAVNHLAVRGGPYSIAAASDDKLVSVWAPQGTTPVAVFKEHKDAVTAVAFHPTLNRLVSAGKDRSIYLWEFDPENSQVKIIQTFRGHAAPIEFLAFSRDGATLLSGGLDRAVIQWDVSTGEEITRFGLFENQIVDGGARPDLRRVVLVGRDGSAALFTGEEMDLLLPGGGRATVRDASIYAALPQLTQEKRLPGWTALAAGLDIDPTSPGGNRVVLVGGKNVGEYRDIGTSKTMFEFRDDRPMISATFNPDGTAFLVGTQNGAFTAWDAAEGTRLRRFQGHSDAVLSLKFRDDALRVLSGSADRTAVLWDATTGGLLKVLRGHTDRVTAVDFSTDGRLLTASADQTLRLWDENARHVATLTGNEGPVTGACFNHAGNLVVAVSEDKKVRIWELRKPSGTVPPTRTIEGFNDVLTCLDVSPNDRFLAVGGREGRLLFLTLPDARPVFTAELLPPAPKPPPNRKNWRPPILQPEPVTALRFSPDGARLLSSSNLTLYVWDLRSDAKTPVPTDADGTRTQPTADPYALLPAQKLLTKFRLPGEPTYGPWISPDESRAVAVLGGDTLALMQLDGDPGAPEGMPTSTWTDNDRLLTAAVLRDRDTFILGDNNGRLYLRNVGEKIMSPSIKVHRTALYELEISQNGNTVLSGDADGMLALWDGQGRFLARLVGHKKAITSLALSPDGSRALSASEDGSVVFWDTSTQEKLMTFPEHTPRGACDIAFSRDGKRFASIGKEGRIVLYTVQPQPKVFAKIESATRLKSVALSPDGSLAATAGEDGRVLFWDVKSGRAIAQLPLQRSLGGTLYFSADGRKLLLTAELEIRVFNVPTITK